MQGVAAPMMMLSFLTIGGINNQILISQPSFVVAAFLSFIRKPQPEP